MIAVKTVDVTQDFKRIAERIVQGEKILISRPKNENIVMITETEYNQLNKLRESATTRTLKDVLRETQAQAMMNGTSELTMDDINDIVAEVRESKKCEQV